MDCKVTCFDRVMHLVNPLPTDKLKDAVEIIREYSFQELLDFGVENGCFSKSQASTLYDGIIMWEDLEGNYYEENHDRYIQLIEKMGITENVMQMYPENDDKRTDSLSFTTDWEKMRDFFSLTKDEFLKSYSYLTEDEFNATLNEVIGKDYDWYFAKEDYNLLKDKITFSKQKADALVGKVFKGELCIELYTRYSDKTLNPRMRLFYSVYAGNVESKDSFNTKYPYDYVGGGEISLMDSNYESFKERAEIIFSWYIHDRSISYESADLINKARYGIY